MEARAKSLIFWQLALFSGIHEMKCSKLVSKTIPPKYLDYSRK